MRRLVLHLLLIFSLFKHQPGAGVGAVQHNVDFIEGEPVFHQTVKSFKAGAGVVAEKIHHFAVAPGAVLHHQMHRHVKMAQRHQRLDTVLFALLEQRTIEGDTLRIRLLLVAAREQAAPGDGGAKDAEPHLRHQGDIFLVAVVEIDRLVAGVEFVFAKREALLQA